MTILGKLVILIKISDEMILTNFVIFLIHKIRWVHCLFKFQILEVNSCIYFDFPFTNDSLLRTAPLTMQKLKTKKHASASKKETFLLANKATSNLNFNRLLHAKGKSALRN